MIQQFAYVHGVAEISLLSGKKIQNAAVQFFFLKATTWAYRSKSPLYGLNLKKSLIKNYITLFQVRSSHQPDQIQLDSTKFNKTNSIVYE